MSLDGGGAPSHAADPPAPAPAPPSLVFITHREVRAPTSKSNKKTGYSLSFYLVTRTGGEVLAVTGKDAGDAHYRYNSLPEFDAGPAPPGGPGPLVDCHNRRDLLKWLEAVARASQKAADFHVVSSDDDRAAGREVSSGGGGGKRRTGSPDAAAGAPDTAPGGPTTTATGARRAAYPVYIAHRSTKFDMPDGRRGLKWWLVADSGVEYMAATGEERDARGGLCLSEDEAAEWQAFVQGKLGYDTGLASLTLEAYEGLIAQRLVEARSFEERQLLQKLADWPIESGLRRLLEQR